MAGLQISILQGNYKNKKIPMPEKIHGHSAVTPHKIKEAVFQIMRNKIVTPDKALFIDLFCGSGQMGFEAVSRGYASVIFYDISNERIQAAKNWSQKNFRDDDQIRCKFENKDSVRSFTEILEKDYADYRDIVIFADPPYNLIYKKKLIIDYIIGQFTSLSKDFGDKSIILIIQTSRQDTFKSEWINSEDFISENYPHVNVRFYHYAKNLIITLKKELPNNNSRVSLDDNAEKMV